MLSIKNKNRFMSMIVILTMVFNLLNVSPVLAAGPYTVNSTGDSADASAGDGFCETATPGECTLRAAIQEANAQFGTDTINFNIPGAGVRTISPSSGFPAISSPVIIDGLTQPGASCAAWPPALQIELDGTNAGSVDAFGFFGSSGNTVRGLIINRYYNGIHIPNSSNNTIQCNFLGTDASGTTALGNGLGGVYIQQASTNNLIGGALDSQRNLISGNTNNQISLTNFGSAPNNNTIENNYIGTDVTGTEALGGGASGGISIFGGSGNIIRNNLVSGNSNNGGILFSGDATRHAVGNIVQSNLIGTNAAGTASVGNIGSGLVLGAFGNYHVENTVIGTNGDGLNDALEGNVISGNTQKGISITGSAAFGNVIAGNRIGTDAAGTTALGNDVGIIIEGGSNNNRIGTNLDGTSDTLERNIISGNVEGISLWGSGIDVLNSGRYGHLPSRATTSALTADGPYLPTRPNTGEPRGGIVNLQLGIDKHHRRSCGGRRQHHRQQYDRHQPVNQGYGMYLDCRQQLIGGTTASAGDIITAQWASLAKTVDAMAIRDDNNTIQLTASTTTAEGITLGGGGANDALDADTGANQPAKLSCIVRRVDCRTVIDSSRSAVANSAYPITPLIFMKPIMRSAAKAKTHIGSDNLAGPGSSTVNLGNALALGVGAGDLIIATATDSNGNTSLFSPSVVATPTVTSLPITNFDFRGRWWRPDLLRSHSKQLDPCFWGWWFLGCVPCLFQRHVLPNSFSPWNAQWPNGGLFPEYRCRPNWSGA